MNIMKSLILCLVMFAAPFSDDLPDMSGITKALHTGDASVVAVRGAARNGIATASHAQHRRDCHQHGRSSTL